MLSSDLMRCDWLGRHWGGIAVAIETYRLGVTGVVMRKSNEMTSILAFEVYVL